MVTDNLFSTFILLKIDAKYSLISLNLINKIIIIPGVSETNIAG